MFDQVASDPTVSRLIAALAADADAATTAIRASRAAARERVWARLRPVPGSCGSQVVIDLDAKLVTAHSDKELAAPTFKRGLGFHPCSRSSITAQFLHHITELGLEYPVGFYGVPPLVEALGKVPRQAWRAAIDGDGQTREGAQVAELIRCLPATLTGRPAGMRLNARRERPHPGAQLRLTDHEG